MAERKVTFLVGANIKEFTDAMGKVERKFKRTGRNIQRVGETWATRITAPMVGLAGIALKTAADFETLQQSMNALNGSAEEGARNFERLKEFSARTPFQLKDLASAQNMLQGFGQSADDAFESMKMIGDISAITGGSINDIGIAFGQAAAEGRLMTRDIRQLINQGVPAIKLLADTMGVAQSEVLDLASQGKISFDILQQSFRDATNEGGMFANGMERQSKTIAGLFSTLKDNVSIALGDIGQAISDAFSLKDIIPAAIERIGALTKRFREFSDQTKRRIIIVSAAIAGLGPTLIGVGATVAALGATIGALTSPVVILIGGIAGIVSAFEYVGRNLDVFENRFRVGFARLKNFAVQAAVDIRDVFAQLFMGVPGFDQFNLAAKGALLSLKEPIPELKGDFQSLGEFIKSVGDDILGVFDKTEDLDARLNSIVSGAKSGGGGGGGSVSGGSGNTFSGSPVSGSSVGALGILSTSPERINQIANGFTRMAESAQRVPAPKKMFVGLREVQEIATNFTASFGSGMSNVIVQGKKLADVLKNIGKLLLSSAIQKGISLLLTGGLSGAGGFFGGGGLFGSIFGVNDALITSSGDVVKFHPDDNILAMKDFSGLGGMGGGGSKKVMIENVLNLDGREVYRSIKDYEYKVGA